MKAAIQVSVSPPFRDLQGRFTKATKRLLETKRGKARDLARRLVGYMFEEAPKKTGTFAGGIGFRTFIEGETVGFKVTTPQPLGRWIIGGTPAHRITARNAATLAFFWPDGPQGPKDYFFPSVWHPGTKPNRFHARAYRRWIPGAKADLNRLARGFVRDLA